MATSLPEISLVVPCLNEATELPELFASLVVQEGVSFEVILCDGGSCDGSLQVCRDLVANTTFSVQIICTPRGRGLQMNSGAAIARSDLLLFLHADSRFNSPNALKIAISAYRKESDKAAYPVAARFRICFSRHDTQPSLAYFFYESKARLERAECIRGDQGFLLTRTLFNFLGGFDSTLPYLEDIRLVAATAVRAEWLLLPAEISTSARRFETEGLYERQVANAIITDAVATGWTEFFSALPGIYRCSSFSGRLQLFPLLDGIRNLLASKPTAWRRTFWRGTGRHVAGNIWQLFFWLDARSAFINGSSPDDVSARRLQWFQRNLDRFTRGMPAETITAAAVWIWFRVLLIRYRKSTKTN